MVKNSTILKKIEALIASCDAKSQPSKDLLDFYKYLLSVDLDTTNIESRLKSLEQQLSFHDSLLQARRLG